MKHTYNELMTELFDDGYGEEKAESKANLGWLYDILLSYKFLVYTFCIFFTWYYFRSVAPEFDGNLLHEAAFSGDTWKLHNALHKSENGVKSVSIGNPYGNTALHIACKRGFPLLVKDLLKVEGIGDSFNKRNRNEDATPLMCAMLYRFQNGDTQGTLWDETYGSTIGAVLRWINNTEKAQKKALAIEKMIKDYAKSKGITLDLSLSSKTD